MAEMLASRDPRRGTVVGEVAVTDPADVGGIVAAGREAFASWSGLSHPQRRLRLKRFKRTVLRRGEHIAEVVRSETGRPLPEAYAYDVLTALTVVDYYVRNAARLLRPTKTRSWPFLSTAGRVEYRPRGVVGIITPWNYPFFLPMIPTITALAAGCTVVLKPSEVTPLSGQLIADLASEAGLPPGLVQVIHGGGSVGATLVGSRVDMMAFTGSTRVGKLVAAEAAKTLTPVVLELGGNDAMVVLDDADLRQTARAAVWGGMINAGQTCVAVERLYVVDAVYDAFLAELEAAYDAVAAGTGDARDIGPVIHPPQADVVERHLSDAVAKGARVRRGGERLEHGGGIYIAPTLIVDVDHSMDLMREETFGPVLPVMRVADEAAALEMANDSALGLHGSVWSRNRRRAERFAARMATGTVAVNDVAVNFMMPSLPFGGAGDSGMGVNLGPEGIRAYCHTKSITSARLPWPTTRLLGTWYPRRRGMRYWKALAEGLFRW